MLLGFGYFFWLLSLLCFGCFFFFKKAENYRSKEIPVGQNFVILFFCFCLK